MPDFSLSINAAIFGAGAIVVWIAGTRLSRYADALAERTGVGRAFIGALLLGGITSLPELVTTITASTLGNAELAANNIFGGVAMQVAILAVVDATEPDDPLTVIAARPAIVLQGALLVLLLSVAAAGILVGEPEGWSVGPWSTLLFTGGVFGFFLINRYDDSGWKVVPAKSVSERRERREARRKRDEAAQRTLGALVGLTVAGGAAILVAGYAVAHAADQLAEQTGLGSSFMGVALVAVSTSLPELSTTLGAVRLQRYEMAFSNIFGANILDVGLLFVADLAFREGAVLDQLGIFSLFAIMLGVFLTTVYLVGLIERRNTQVWRFGWDSIVVLVAYAGGLYTLYTLK